LLEPDGDPGGCGLLGQDGGHGDGPGGDRGGDQGDGQVLAAGLPEQEPGLRDIGLAAQRVIEIGVIRAVATLVARGE
jgi:hypothetical protein